MGSNYPYRKKPASGVFYVEGRPTVVYDTVCTKLKRAWLDNELIHQILLDVWRQADAWLVGRYVVMPDHVHYFAWATESGIELDNWVRYWKSQFSRAHRQEQLRMQAGHWDRRMRSESHYEEKWNYVFENPVRAGLVTDPLDWPFHGVLHDLRW